MYKQYRNVFEHITSLNSVKTDCTKGVEQALKKQKVRTKEREREREQVAEIQLRSKHIHSTAVKDEVCVYLQG